MTISDWLMISAVLMGPILAVQTQKLLESMKAKKNRKVEIFKTLMATRGTPLDPRHVTALNMIDLEFTTKKAKEKKVVDSWKLYLEHLNSLNIDYTDPNYSAKLAIRAEKTNDLLSDLLYNMSQLFGYGFDKVHLMKGSYTPMVRSDYEVEQNYIRKGIVRILLGNQSVPINIINNIPQSDVRADNKKVENKDVPESKSTNKKRKGK